MAHQQDARGRGEVEGPALGAAGTTIAAVATPPGRGGIGVVRISGPRARAIAEGLAGALPAPRHAHVATFRSASGAPIDQGIVLYFAAPHSYTGEDVVELQGHGGPVVMRELLGRCVALGASLAGPGEFTRRAFLNDRIDLAQAESVADLIDASSAEAAASAARSLAGEFSERIAALVAALTDLRAHVEACIDFPEEEIEPADIAAQAHKLEAVRAKLDAVQAQARQGAVLREGLTVALVGAPNVGKSSLLNRLAGEELAIVTPVAGTTRDAVRATLSLEGVPIHLVDTAGLREAGDEVERLGIERTWRAAKSAGAIVFVTEGDGTGRTVEREQIAQLSDGKPVAHVLNKIDLAGLRAGSEARGRECSLRLSARTGEGVDLLRSWLLEVAGWQPHGEGVYMARERHLEALREAAEYLAHAEVSQQAFELYAENLKLAQASLSRITGEVTSDALLGEIFSRFCIGK